MLSFYTEAFFSDQLGTQPMKVPPINIFFKDNAVPHHISGPRPLPQNFDEAAQTEMDNHLTLRVLTKCDEPTD